MTPNIQVVADAAALAQAAADRITEVVVQAVRERGVARIALAGGSTPERAYRRLAESKDIDWGKVEIFLSDERFVPLNHPDSNFGMVARSLLDAIEIPAENLFPVDVGSPSAEEAAGRYEARILKSTGSPPRFDLVLLGLGEDGHTASLFPGAPSLELSDCWVVASAAGRLPPPVERVTLTLPTINAAHQVLLLVTGAKKAEVVKDVLAGAGNRPKLPAARVDPTDGRLLWLLDSEAANLL